MDDDKCILLIRGMKPFYSDKFKIEKHPEYKKLGENNNIYDLRKLQTYEEDEYRFEAKELVFSDIEILNMSRNGKKKQYKNI